MSSRLASPISAPALLLAGVGLAALAQPVSAQPASTPAVAAPRVNGVPMDDVLYPPAPVPGEPMEAPATERSGDAFPAADRPAEPLVVPVAGFDDPIISDEEFGAAIPALDAPLESLADFDARTRLDNDAVATGTADGTDPGDDALAELPALDDGDPAEAVADATVTDPALAEPLTPLAGFDVTPVEVGDDPADERTEIAYTTEVRGLDVPLARDLFNQLSTLDGDGEATNAAQVDARARENAALIGRILESLGYYAGTTDVAVTPGVDGALAVVLTAKPGRRYDFSSVTLNGADTVPDDLARRELPLAVGDPIDAARVQGAEANLALALGENGYPFAELGERDILLSDADATGAYTLPVETGPRASFGGIRTTGDLAFDADHVEVLRRYDPGQLYDSRLVDDLRQALVATSLFSSVSVEPTRTGEVLPDGTERVDLLVTQDAGPSRALAGAVGYGTGQGFRLEGSWTHRNLFPPEGALIATGVVGTQEQALGATFRRSNAGQRDRTVSLTAQVAHTNFDAFEAFTGTLAGTVARVSTPIWQKRFTYSYGFELTGTNEQDFNFALGERDRQTFFIGALPGQLGFDTSDDLLNPTRGYRALVRLSPEVSLGRGTNPYARVLVEGSTYYPIGESIVLAGRLRVGTIQGIDRSSLAPSRRYYGGGGGSVRGFGFQELGPKDPNDDPIGGRSLNEAAFEVRYRFGNFGIVPFVDVGQVYESTLPDFSSLRAGVGIGGRFYTNFGPFRVDVATPIGRRDGESAVSVYVSIGQAF